MTTENEEIFYEIEKKFLLKNDNWKKEVSESFHIEQGYLVNIKKKTIRIRKKGIENPVFFLTIKCATDTMGKNIEIEKNITNDDYDYFLSANNNKIELIKKIIFKYKIAWEINEVNIIEKEITKKELKELNSICKYKVKKIRNIVVKNPFKWEIDQFTDHNKGIEIAEIEFKSSEKEEFDKPEWLGEEVTDDKRYYNFYLSRNKI